MEKIMEFLKRNSFYVILSVCLVVLGAVALATGSNKGEETAKKPVATNVEKGEEETGKQIEGAELVKDEEIEKQEKAKDEKTSIKEETEVQTNAKPSSEFIDPVKDGLVTREFNITPRIEKDGKSANVYKGIDIEAIKGTDVVSIADGEVLQAQSGDSREGNYVTIKQANGIVVMYGNLDSKLNVKQGDKITQGTVVGKVGASIKGNPTDRVSKEYLLLHVEKEREAINPLDVFKNLKIKK
ncbi:M23 family metallopeptidase [uncultured Clostridium sp.]|uniref:M23 family metallopeptidase n=1 Tax=uncultured Clostridium sp. TaxID=59620 RepID=UPI002608A4B8|nr:M23 family metallopeptidase [uncultured Clostridium sp.]